MNQGLIPRRYAKALYKVDLEHGTTSTTYALMQQLVKVFTATPELKTAIANPFVSTTDKIKMLETAAAVKPGDDTTYDDFLRLLTENHRIDMIDLIALAYIDIYRKANNIHHVEVITAAPLDVAATDRIKALISKHISGGTMEYTGSIDPDIIGGFVVNIDNQRLDASLAHEFNQLRQTLLN